MASDSEIQRYCDAIARLFSPEKIILFGSHAYGKPHKDSDVDLLVVMPHAKRFGRRPSLAIRRKIPAGFPVDIVVRESREFKKRLLEGDSFLREVVENGRVIYEANPAGSEDIAMSDEAARQGFSMLDQMEARDTEHA